MQIEIEQTKHGNPAMYQVIGDSVGSQFFKEIVNEDGSSKQCIAIKLNRYITKEIKFLVEIKVNDYVFEKRRDNSANKWVIDVYRIVSIDYDVLPTATLELFETIDLRDFLIYKMNLKKQ